MSTAVVDQKPADAAARASGSSFYTAMRILPAPQRRAMFEIYSFCRAVDDIADDPGERTERSRQLQQWRDIISAIYAGETPPHLLQLAEAIRAFGLRQEDFQAVIDGMQMDVDRDIQAPSWETLDLYCDRVASAVGRLSVRVFGMEENDGLSLSHHLGRALQLTNILRDLDEDAGIGRLYLPQEALTAAGVPTGDPTNVLSNPQLEKACQPVIARAEQHFAQAHGIMQRNPRKLVRAPRIMGEAYRAILDALVLRGFAPPRKKIKLGRARILSIVLRNAFI